MRERFIIIIVCVSIGFGFGVAAGKAGCAERTEQEGASNDG